MRTGSGVIWARRACGPVGGAALVVLCLTVYLPGFVGIPPVDRDESRFAQASRQMFESVALPPAERDPELHGGGLVVPRVQGRERLSKPPLIYWAQAASAAVLTRGEPERDAIWMYRVPSLLAALITVLATWRMGCSMFDARAAWLGGALLAVSPVFVWEAHQARADHVMVAFTTLAMWSLWCVWRGRERPTPPAAPGLLLWVFVALGILTKGPITPMVVVFGALALSITGREWAWLRGTRPVLGPVVLIAIVSPWLFGVARHVGLDRYWSVVFDEVFVRAGSAKEGHWGPPGYHAVLLVALFWPGSLLTGLAVVRGFRRGFRVGARPRGGPGRWWRRLGHALKHARPARPAECFLLAWIVPSWVVFELSVTKLPHYTMPLYPAVALLTSRGILAAASGAMPLPRGQRLGTAIWLVLSGLLAVGVPIGLFTLGVRHSPWIIILGIIWLASIVVFATLALHALKRNRILALQLAGLILALGLWPFALHALLPGTKRLFLTELLAERIAEADSGGDRPLAAIGYHEDSLVFHTRARVILLDRQLEGEYWNSHPDGLLIVPKEHVLRSHSVIAEVEGFNYSKGSRQRVTIVRPFWLGIDPQESEP